MSDLRQLSKGLRRGYVFPLRLTDDERDRLEDLKRRLGGPRALGPWIIWRALDEVLPAPGPGITSAEVLPAQLAGEACDRTGITSPDAVEVIPPRRARTILDLCAGSGAWSEPYKAAGYNVVRVTLPELDVRTFVPPPNVWGLLAAPPCTEFSRARTTPARPRDFILGMETVNACMRIVAQCGSSLRWWALENPASGDLPQFLGPPVDSFQPCDFGDAWTKRTGVWGRFVLPARGPFIEPTGSAMDRPTPALRAVTPPGFAQAFFRANP